MDLCEQDAFPWAPHSPRAWLKLKPPLWESNPDISTCTIRSVPIAPQRGPHVSFKGQCCEFQERKQTPRISYLPENLAQHENSTLHLLNPSF